MKTGPFASLLLLLGAAISSIDVRGQGCAPQINFAPYLTFCQGNSVTLNATNANATYLWSTGATTATLTVSTSGTYWVTATNPCGTASDTIQVMVAQPINVQLGPDFNLCQGSSANLSVPSALLTTYAWSTGATTNSIAINSPGTYWVQVTNACGTFTDSIAVGSDVAPTVALGPDLQLCPGGTATLSMSGTGSYLWSNGSTGSSITVNTSGTYWGRIINGCGTFSDTVTVTVQSNPQINMPPTAVLCTGGTILNAGSVAGTYLWNTGATTSQITATTPGTYWVTLATACGNATDTIEVLPALPVSVNLGADTTLCQGTPLVLNTNTSGLSVVWDNNSTSTTRTVTTSGTYWVTVGNGCQTATDTIHVQYIPNPAASMPDTLYTCAGTPYQVTLPNYNGYATYAWSNGLTGNPVNLINAGNYSVTVTTPCGTFTESVYLKHDQPLNPNLGPDTLICSGSVPLAAGAYAQTILWSTGATTPTIQASTRGDFWVSLTNACGTYTDTIYVDVPPKPAANFPPVMYLCTGGSLNLTVSQDVTFSYLWSNGATSHQTSVNAPGTYWVLVTSPCDTVTDTVQVSLQNPAVFSLGADTTLCAGTPLTLGTTPPDGVSVLWSTGATSATISPTASGTYTCRWTNACGPVYDTIVVTFLTAPASPLPAAVAFCNGSTLTLNATSTAGTTYLWDDGTTNPQRVINQEGWYSITLTNLCGQTVDSVYARADTALLPVNLGPDTIFCAGTVVLDPGPNPYVSYLWSTGATSPTLGVSSTGTYWVRVENSCETRYDTIQVLVTGPPALVLGTQVAFCQGTVLTLNAQNPGCSYQWSTGATSQTLAVTTGGKYWVTIANNCGQLTDTVEVVVENPLTLNLGPDSVLCPGDSMTLNAYAQGAYYLWSTGATSPTITVQQTGNYWVEIWNTCGSRKDTVSVIVLTEPQFQLPQDTFICNVGGNKVLQVPQWPHHTIAWSDGSTQPTFTATQPGTYWVTLANKCSSYSDTIVLTGENPLVMDLGVDDTLCQGSIFPVNTGITDRPVVWSDGSVGPTLFVTQPGTYWAVAENSCGPASDTVTFHFQAAPDFPRTDTVVCMNDSAQFNIPNFEGSFVWFDGNTNPQRSFWRAGIYSAELTNVCGTFLKEFQVRKTNCDCDVYLADAFTPNGDGINDRFVPGLTCEIRSFELRIYDRWGNQVFAGFNTDETWDGTFKGQPAEQGVYTYRLFYIWDVYGDFIMRERTGRIALIR